MNKLKSVNKFKLVLLFVLFIVVPAFAAGCQTNKLEQTTPTPSTYVTEIKETAEPKTTELTPLQTPAPQPSINEYTINLEVDPENKTVTGIEKVVFVNKTNVYLDKTYFNLYLNAFSGQSKLVPFFSKYENKVYANGRDYGHINILSVSYNNENVSFNVNETVLEVIFDKPLATGEVGEITLQFEASVPKINSNTGANDYATWFGNFVPTLAVYNKNGFNTKPYYPAGDPFFTEIANFTVNITTPKEYQVVATGDEVVTETENNKTTSFSARLVRDFAFCVGNKYKKMTYTGQSGVEINMFYYSDLKNIQPLLEVAEKSISFFNEKIGTYPYHKLDIVETGLPFPSGMEYPQIIFIDSSYFRSERVFKSLTHEICHQWFYNIIGNDQIREAWLDEGISSLLQEFLFYDDYQLDAEMKSQYETLQENLKEAGNTKLSDDLSVYSSWAEYHNVHYLRAKLMFYSLKVKMGDEKFYEFLKQYYTKYSFKIAYKEDLIKTAEETYGADLTDFFNEWIYNKEMPPFIGRNYNENIE